MSKKNVNKSNVPTITFEQAPDSKKAVIAVKDGKFSYLPYALLCDNEPIYKALGGSRVEGVKGFRVEFPKVANATDFIKQGITHMSTKEYEASRKTEPKAAPAPAKSGKGRKTAVQYKTVTDSDGCVYKVRVDECELVSEPTPAKKSNGNGTHKPMSGRVGVESEQKVLLEAKGRKPAKAKGGNKPTPAKTEKSTPKRGRKGKGDGFDYSTIKGATKSEKNKALHHALVKMGLADSRTAEYQAVWNNRPWAK